MSFHTVPTLYYLLSKLSPRTFVIAIYPWMYFHSLHILSTFILTSLSSPFLILSALISFYAPILLHPFCYSFISKNTHFISYIFLAPITFLTFPRYRFHNLSRYVILSFCISLVFAVLLPDISSSFSFSI